ncbi:phospho-2-dehydro-3-deoxyheptonate aldolase [Pseudozyma hubeiensis SY62]|uniref:Phospho-2-dehydro-3-deoxyheptonate aldolase n=1 Tax=Pseudozyma hubeiensis (strain SY62) TaxID=1305764 RepID=R9NVV2_PSEHS|nr:phospho-2-dehydro-3-deoxyheptonate aldolase [Pseudozyma hubeiensis SY62]GAC92547.1 phospho-2-dehydro-3-deoxyheptonate aldolase [Pseudozyma hubeiensis SY62]
MSGASASTREYHANPTWRSKKEAQQVDYPSQEAFQSVMNRIERLPGLVSPNEIDRLRTQLASVAEGNAFLLQTGDCAELFDYCDPEQIQAKLKLSLLMSLILIWGARKPVVRIGRIAGQYAKPRSKPTEIVTKIDPVTGQASQHEIMSFRGDNINAFSAEPASGRIPDPERLLQAYFHSAATLNHIRSELASGLADLHAPRQWSFQHVQSSALQAEFESVVDSLTDALDFMRTIGADPSTFSSSSVLNSVDYFISHEGLSLGYEEALTRLVRKPTPANPHSARNVHPSDLANGAPTGDSFDRYDLSAHTIWLGDRTRQLDGAHVDFFSSIRNPVGVKVGPSMKPSELIQILDILNPDVPIPAAASSARTSGWSTPSGTTPNIVYGKEKGRVMVIIRLGAAKVTSHLPPLLEAIAASNHKDSIILLCDPMHGNTQTSPYPPASSDPNAQPLKTRSFGDIISEILSFLEIISSDFPTLHLGGVHLELTGDKDVTECFGGSMRLEPKDLERGYKSHCDPRLNFEQSLDVAFLLSHYFRNQRLGNKKQGAARTEDEIKKQQAIIASGSGDELLAELICGITNRPQNL